MKDITIELENIYKEYLHNKNLSNKVKWFQTLYKVKELENK